jgi:hypothetical protein
MKVAPSSTTSRVSGQCYISKRATKGFDLKIGGEKNWKQTNLKDVINYRNVNREAIYVSTRATQLTAVLRGKAELASSSTRDIFHFLCPLRLHSCG